MQPEVFSKMNEAILALKNITARLSMYELIAFAQARQLAFNVSDDSTLASPYQQTMYLLGLAVTQEESMAKIDFDEKVHDKICDLLNQIFRAYSENFLLESLESGKDESPIPVMDSHYQSMITNAAFIDYFFTSRNMNTEQLKDWLMSWFEDGSELIKDKYGLNITEILEIVAHIEELIETNIKICEQNLEFIEKSRKNFIEAVEKDKNNFQIELKNIRQNGQLQKAIETIKNLEFGKICIDDLKNYFGSEKIDAFLKIFGLKRGIAEDFQFLTDKNPVKYKPLIICDSDLYWLINNSFYNAFIDLCEQYLYKIHPKKISLHNKEITN